MFFALWATFSCVCARASLGDESAVACSKDKACSNHAVEIEEKEENAAGSIELIQKRTRAVTKSGLDNLEGLLQKAYAYSHVMPSMAAAFHLNLFDAIPVDGPGVTFDEIVQRTHSTRIGMDALLEAMVGIDAIKYHEDTKLFTNEYSKYTSDENKGFSVFSQSFKDYALGWSVSTQRQFFYIKDSVREGRAVGLTEVLGDYPSIYEARSEIPEVAEDWDKWMSLHDGNISSHLSFIYELPSVGKRIGKGSTNFNGHVLDWCGNTGVNSIDLALSDPTMKLTVLDLPSQVAKAQESIELNGMQGQIDTLGVDLLSPDLSFEDTYDAVLMIHTIREWSEEKLAFFFKIVHSILNVGGFVTMNMVSPHELGDGYQKELSLYSSMYSLYFLTSAANEQYPKTAKKLDGMLVSAGFGDVKAITDSKGNIWVTAVKL
jgi:hypothetical protein